MERTTLFYFGLAVLAGSLGGIHVPINGALSTKINSAVVATFAFYGVAFLLISLVALAGRDRNAFVALKDVSPWYFVAGVISVLVVGAGTFLIPRIGAVNLFATFVASQLVVRMVISHFGWFESPLHPVSLSKLIGGVLLIVGAILVVRPSA